jgi:hypothetical protein
MSREYKHFYMKHKYIFFLAVVVFSALFSGCNFINPAEPIPSYIHIQKIGLSTDASIEGTNSSKITDAWVYIDDQLIGCYELPVTFPVLYDGTHRISVKAGIKVNGIAATRAPYPFYQNFSQSINLSRGTITSVSPTVTYVSGLNWTTFWMEDFESSGISFARSPSGTDTSLLHVTSPPEPANSSLIFEGSGSGVAYLDNNRHLFECISSTSYVLPKGDTFLEFDYKSNYTFAVGVFAHNGTSTVKTKVLNIHPSDKWNKVYVYLTPTILASDNATDYNIFFGMLNNTGASSLTFSIDNVKLIHY